MDTRKKILVGLGLAVVIGGLAFANLRFNRTTGESVTVEVIARRNLEAVVSASGKIQAKQQVEVSAETMGKVVELAVVEGQRVSRGQHLLQIDPRNLETTVRNREASLATATSELEQTRAQVENARVALRQAEETLARQTDLYQSGLLAREAYESTQNEVEMRRIDLRVRETSVTTQQQRIRQAETELEGARYDLNKVRIVSPIDGLVTRRNIEEGETVVVGTMNNAGTVLLTIADLSVIEAEIEVDETDIPDIEIGQYAEVTIDAIPNQTFKGQVTEVGNAPIQAAGTAQAAQTGRATNFMVVITIEGEVPNVRPGFTCTAAITTATRDQAISVPIQAVTVRERIVDDATGRVIDPGVDEEAGSATEPPPALEPGQRREEFEGVFVMRDGVAAFVPIRTGIVGERHFEVLEGLEPGEQVITGPFAAVRDLRDGDPVRATTTAPPGG